MSVDAAQSFRKFFSPAKGAVCLVREAAKGVRVLLVGVVLIDGPLKAREQLVQIVARGGHASRGQQLLGGG